MKRFYFTIIALIAVTFSANGQLPGWYRVYEKPDELLGTKEKISLIYISGEGEDGTCGFSESGMDFIMVSSRNGFFDYKIVNSEVYYADAIIGLYVNSKLIEKIETHLIIFSDNTSRGAFIEEDADKIKYHLRNNGSVRIVLPLYKKGNFDLTIPMIKDITDM